MSQISLQAAVRAAYVAYRDANGLRDAELAQHLGLTNTAVSRWLANDLNLRAEHLDRVWVLLTGKTLGQQVTHE